VEISFKKKIKKKKTDLNGGGFYYALDFYIFIDF